MDQLTRRRPRIFTDTGSAAVPKPMRSVVPCPLSSNSHLSPSSDQIARDAFFSARGVRRSRLARGRDIVIRGSRGDCIYFNHDGWLARYKILHRGTRQIMDFILPGQVFGLSACVFQRAPYSVLTLTEATVCAVPFGVVDTVFEQDPALGKALFWSTIHDAAILGEHLVDAGRRSAYERVSHLLLELSVRLNSGRPVGEMTFSLPLTQELIADALGLTAVHVNRMLRSLREDKLIEVDGRSVTIIAFEALSLLSDFERAYLGETVS